MKKAGVLTALFLLYINSAFSQYYTNQNKVWAYGNHAGVNFTSGKPVAFASAINTSEGSTSVSDAAGNLLFYTDGKTVFNRAGATMPSGAAIVPFSTYSTTQAAVVMPTLSDPNQYYIFSLEEEGFVPASRLAYSIVDMSLSGGMGDVVSSSTHTLVDSSLSEKMIAIPGSSCNIWLLTHKSDSRSFWAYNITASGISTPVVSSFTTPSIYRDVIGVMNCSPDTKSIVLQINSGVPFGTELYDFDTATGIVSNRKVLDSLKRHYGAEFSPDSKKLYSGHYNPAGASTIEQYDLTSPVVTAIQASKATIVTGVNGAATQLRLAPDGKIYLNSFSDLANDFLDVIDKPNIAGTGCGYVSHAVKLSTGSFGFLGLPGMVVAYGGTGIVATTNSDTAVCIVPEGNAKIFPKGPATEYLWNDGDTASFHNVSAAGAYWVLRKNGCTAILDTINVSVNFYPAILSGPDSVCVGNSITLSDTSKGGVWTSSAPAIATVGSGNGSVTGIAVGTVEISYAVFPGCPLSKTIRVLPPCANAIEEAIGAVSEVHLFPNPAQNLCTISVTGIMCSGANVVVSDIAGRAIRSYVLTGRDTVVSVADLAPGVYQCRVVNGEHTVAWRKLIIVR